MGKVPGLRRIVASVLVVGSTAAGLAIGAAGSAGAGRGEPNCEVDEPQPAPALIIQPREEQCAELEVTKVVNGTAPEGTVFRVVVQCDPRPPDERGADAQQLPPGQLPPFSTALEFPAGGGTQTVFVAGPSSCTISESPPPGCTLAGISPASVEITQPNLFQVNVTNNCAAPTPVAAAAAPPAQPPVVVVVAAPRLTG